MAASLGVGVEVIVVTGVMVTCGEPEDEMVEKETDVDEVEVESGGGGTMVMLKRLAVSEVADRVDEDEVVVGVDDVEVVDGVDVVVEEVMVVVDALVVVEESPFELVEGAKPTWPLLAYENTAYTFFKKVSPTGLSPVSRRSQMRGVGTDRWRSAARSGRSGWRR